MKHLSPWRKEKGATAAKQKWCHGNIPILVAHGDTGAKGGVTWASHARWWGDPDFRVPTGRWHGKRGASQGRFDHGANDASHSTHAFGPRRSFRVIPSKRSNETVRIRSGVEEVGVHGTSSEVVVHGVGRGSSCSRGDDSGSSCSRDGSGSRSWRVIM